MWNKVRGSLQLSACLGPASAAETTLSRSCSSWQFPSSDWEKRESRHIKVRTLRLKSGQVTDNIHSGDLCQSEQALLGSPRGSTSPFTHPRSSPFPSAVDLYLKSCTLTVSLQLPLKNPICDRKLTLWIIERPVLAVEISPYLSFFQKDNNKIRQPTHPA